MKKAFFDSVVSAGIEPATQGFSVFFLRCQNRHKNRSDCF